MNTNAGKMVLDGKLDPLSFRDCTANDLRGRLQMAVAFKRDRYSDYMSALGLTDTLADLRHAYPHLTPAIENALLEMRAMVRVGGMFRGSEVRSICATLLTALESLETTPAPVTKAAAV